MSDQMGLLFFKIVVLNVAILYRSAKITHMELRKPPNTGRLAFCFNANTVVALNCGILEKYDAKNSVDRNWCRIAEARSHGDLSENAEYEAAKEKQGFIEGRIAEIEHKLSLAHIIDPKETNADGKVVFGATVKMQDLETEEVVSYQIVGEDEADIKQAKIFVGSPIARALIGKEEGDVAEVQAPGGVREYEILEVFYI